MVIRFLHRKIKAKGFTLIELLVVIAIISLLASIILASLKSAKDKAVLAKGLQTMRSLQLALNLYYADHGDWPTSRSDGTMVITSGEQAGWQKFYNLLLPYMKSTPDSNYSTYISNNMEFMNGGLLYLKGTEAKPVQYTLYNSIDSSYIGCVRVFQAYYIAEVFMPQNKVTLGDNGFDPDSIDYHEGHIYLDPSIPASSCEQNLEY